MSQTSGASNVGDWPESGGRVDTSVHSDVTEDIFRLEKEFPEDRSPTRTLNQFVIATGEKEGVKTFIVVPPLICKYHLILMGIQLTTSVGRGTGLFTEGVGQVHQLIKLALKKSQAV